MHLYVGLVTRDLRMWLWGVVNEWSFFVHPSTLANLQQTVLLFTWAQWCFIKELEIYHQRGQARQLFTNLTRVSQFYYKSHSVIATQLISWVAISSQNSCNYHIKCLQERKMQPRSETMVLKMVAEFCKMGCFMWQNHIYLSCASEISDPRSNFSLID